MNKTLQLPLSTRAAITQNSYNETDKTIEVVFATETEVKRRTWDGTNYIEILGCKPENVRLERVNQGANLVDSHSTWTIKSILGVVERAWVENKQCKAIVRLSQREEVAGYVQDIISGITRNISVGYAIHTTDITEDNDKNTITVRVTDWEPAELSVLSVPADPNAGIRSQTPAQNFHEVKYNTRNMPEETPAAVAAPTTPAPATAAAATAAVVPAADANAIGAATTTERTRISDIQLAVRTHGITDDAFYQKLITDGSTIDQARALILDELVKRQAPASVTATSVTTVGKVGDDEGTKTRSALEEVLIHRANPSIALVSDKAKEFRHASLLDMAVIALNARGHNVSLGSMSKDELVKRAMSSSDYPIMLGNVVDRSLRAAYDAATPEWRKFASKRNASDFKSISSVGVGGDFKLKKVLENGEYKEAKMVETGDSFKLDTYGRMISITRKAIINDDLGAFMRFTDLFGRGAMELQSEIVYGLLTANSGGGRILSDGVTLFNAAHKNLAGTGTALGATSLTAARLALRRQTGLTGEKILVRPKYLVVPPELETLAWQLVSAAISPGSTSDANPFKGAFEVLVDPFLEDPKAWYLLADPSTIPVVEYAFLNGQEGLYTEQEIDFNTDNLNIKVRTDFAATIEEFRGVYKNPGA
ncbi:prohead protease/major capsid protein fusion protein [Pedobacter sp. Hv1]|uniref:prohead protease/major capsid protein fusion protein n=1 Tax=Pedobacter sp. Hv1 TaxID=1740090 RepID=UPI0006D8CCAE|nr:prohead protease/major capsid protein fusion protein [Pedobacter sp. Hv1]KQC02091.1 hypothetical protein AQF98_00520 [Pedobacter sp. Hv1]